MRWRAKEFIEDLIRVCDTVDLAITGGVMVLAILLFLARAIYLAWR